MGTFNGSVWLDTVIMFIKPILKIIPPKWTINECNKVRIWILAEKICTVKTPERSQVNPKKFLYSTAFSAELPCLARHSL